ncbi:MAG: hypothetical protein RLY21_535 [Planctomycetota bacterium]|jgi:hypothetical protein
MARCSCSVVPRLVLALALPLAGVVGCGSGSTDDSLQRLGSVTPQGRVFEQDDFSITVPLRFTGDQVSLSLVQWEAEQAGLRKAQTDLMVTSTEHAIESGALRLTLFDGTSTDPERVDQIFVFVVPSGLFTRTDMVIADQRAAVWLDAEPVKWERFIVNDREIDRLHTRAPKYGAECACYYLDAGALTYMVLFQTAPERVDKFFAESAEIMKRFVPK